MAVGLGNHLTFNKTQVNVSKTKTIPFRGALAGLAEDVFNAETSPENAAYSKVKDKVVHEIKKAKTIAIIPHINPDGDALGSAGALFDLVKKQDNVEQVVVFVPTKMADRYKFLEDTKNFKFIPDLNADELNEQFDLVISVDCAEKKRMGKGQKIFDNAQKTIRIDHHCDSTHFADINLVDTDASSAAQVVKNLAEPLGVEIDKNIAKDLYTGLVTDTAGFRSFKNPIRDFKDAQELAKTGINVQKIYRDAIDYMSRPLFEVYKKAVNSIKFTEDGQIAYINCDNLKSKEVNNKESNDMLAKLTGTIMNNIEGVKVALKLGTNHRNETSVSIRSVEQSAKKIAEKFNGGGHPNAAGCVINAGSSDSLNMLVQVCLDKIS